MRLLVVAGLIAFRPVCALLAAEADTRLGSLSSRAAVGSGENVLIAGFVISGPVPKQVVLRAVGPTLTKLGVAGVLSSPRLELFDSKGQRIMANERWDSALKAQFAQLGAFPLNDSSRDAALFATLSPGNYTAHVSGVNNTTGVALVEIYEVGSESRLISLSTRARLGAGTGTLIAGIAVSPGNGVRRLLLRAAGPALAGLGVNDAAPDPALAVLDAKGQQVASNDNWSDVGRASEISAANAAAGAFPFASASKDAALVVDLPPGGYSIHVTGVNNTGGIVLVEAVDLSPVGNVPTVGLSATNPVTDIFGRAPATVTLTRSGDTAGELSVSYAVSGTAFPGSDYAALPGSVVFPAGAATVTIAITAQGTGGGTPSKTVNLSLTSGASYNLASNRATTVGIIYELSSLFVSRLRPPAFASNTTAYGTSTIQLSADEKTATVSLSSANLSAPITAVYVRLGEVGDSGALYLLQLPNAQNSSLLWTISDVAGATAAEIVAALKAGRVFVSIETAANPGGELAGSLLRGAGSQTFSTPAAAPALDLGTISATDASRFLTQATFGPRYADITALTARGYQGWIDDQLAAPASLHRAATMSDFAFVDLGGAEKPNTSNRQASWFKIAVEGPDQLRQRVAFALSEIFVISDVDAQITPHQEAVANFYDILVRNAFGNYRLLLEEVTLSPMMGLYLSHLRNAKADPQTGATPDENFAREVMQLFTIGLNELLPDGTLKLDFNGQPIPTYDQRTVTEMARVFTGWGYYGSSAKPDFRKAAAERLVPMMLYPSFHDSEAKTIVTGRVLPAGQGGERDLRDTLDTLFNHPSTAPFVSRRLIQRLVTSNPSPGYVYRVARVFEDNGTGTRGDLGAVVKAILLDYEARSLSVAAQPSFGKLKEPLLRITALMRGFQAFTEIQYPQGGSRYYNPDPEKALEQAALRSPTVFNFFEPDYVQPGRLAEAGLYAPEFQIHNDTTAISIPNTMRGYIFPNKPQTRDIRVSVDEIAPLATDPAALIDRVALLLAGNRLRPASRDRFIAALNALPTDATASERARTALYLVATSADAATQR